MMMVMMMMMMMMTIIIIIIIIIIVGLITVDLYSAFLQETSNVLISAIQ